MEMRLNDKKPDIRFLDDMRPVLYDKKWAKTAPNLELYYMYRGVKPQGSRFSATLWSKEKEDLRYDITIIPSRMLGKEFVKTMGHSHIGHYSELYIVLEGEAVFLMQKRRNGEIDDVYAVKAKKNDACVIPAGYEHITINPSEKEKLKIANWANKMCRNDYQPFKKMGGACYFAVAGKERGKTEKWVKNKNYKHIPELRFEKPLEKMPKDLNF